MKLLEIIQAEALGHEELMHPALSIASGMRRLWMMRQDKRSNEEYYNLFNNQVKALETRGVDMVTRGMAEHMLKQLDVPKTLATATAAEVTAAKKDGREQLLAMALLTGANKDRFGGLLTDCFNDYLQGSDKYPTTRSEAYSLMNKWRAPAGVQVFESTSTGAAFATTSESDGATLDPDDASQSCRMDIVCNKCRKKGHFADKCRQVTDVRGTVMVHEAAQESGESTEPELEYGVQFANIEVTTHQCFHSAVAGDPMMDTMVLLDNQSTCNLFCNRKLLRNVRKAERSLIVSSTAGTSRTDLVGDLPGFPCPVWLYEGGLANILSLAHVEDHFEVSYRKGLFKVHRPDGTTRDFARLRNGLFGSSFERSPEATASRADDEDKVLLQLETEPGQDKSLVHTVRDNKTS